MHAFAGGHILD